MFCGCERSSPGAPPNSKICPVCTGHPGSLPVPNRRAVELGAKAALALGGEIAARTKFDRKNYFYPDLPAGYQISQFDEPLSNGGFLEISVNDAKKRIGITRLHLENDAGKLTHVGNFSLVDFNRAGTPLMEIVSEPDLRSAVDARVFAEEVQRILQFVGSSSADLFKGEMRFDASVSLREAGTKKLNPRAEIKNLNSFKALTAAINFEIERQKKLWAAGSPPTKDSTVGWNDEKRETYLLREKESASDYRYFPEPDIPPLILAKEDIAKWRAALPELPQPRRARFVQEYQISEEDAYTLTNSRSLADYFEKVVAVSSDSKKSAGWVLSELLARVKESGKEFSTQPISAENLGQLVKLIATGEISGKIGKEIFPEMWSTGASAAEIIAKKGLAQISDSGELEKLVAQVLQENEKVVADFRAGKENVFGFLVGAVMKISRGQANPKIVNELLRQKLAK